MEEWWKRQDWKSGNSYEEALILIEEEVIIILEVYFMVIVSDVVKRDIDLLNVDPLKVDRII